MKVVEKHGKMGPVETREKCKAWAQTMIEKQKLQFEEFAIMADFSDIYKTMRHDYEAAQLRIVVKLFERRLLTRQLKPVWWGCETQTALAEGELEYNSEHQSTAVFIKYPMVNVDRIEFLRSESSPRTSLLVWTSTPWTLPANRAICVSENMKYTVLEHSTTLERVVVACDLAESVLALDSAYKLTEISFLGRELIGQRYVADPLLVPELECSDKRFSETNSSENIIPENLLNPVLHGDHVTATAGSGLVHTAPAHGMEDFLVGKRHGLVLEPSVNGRGLYIGENIPDGYKELSGSYANGKKSISWILDTLNQKNMVFNVNKKFIHSYPYDWRSKTPVIQRATPQWFINVEKIKATAIELLKNVEFVPEAGRNRLSSFIQSRNEWCISRQRPWGVPLPIVYHKITGEPLEDLETIKFTVSQLQKFGTDQWFEDESDISRWLPSEMDGTMYTKGKDTMDVWFDSGTSWTTLAGVGTSGSEQKFPVADVYLEGSDQHRGWFQSSLLNRIIASDTASENGSTQSLAPYKKIITHGFTLDKKNAKMSKSQGNVISPLQVIYGGGKPHIAAMGTDGLRLWVASSNYTQDVSVSPEVLKRVAENVQKFRVTFKYLLGNLAGFQDPVPYDELRAIDKWALSRLARLETSVIEAFSTHNYARIVREINLHMSSDLSAVYFDISKDRLYTDPEKGLQRRGIQTVLDQILRTYVGVLAPILPLMTQEVWDAYPSRADKISSPFLADWSFFSVPRRYVAPEVETEMDSIWRLRDSVFKRLEELRNQGMFKNKLELSISLRCTGPVKELLERHENELADYFLVSLVEIMDVKDPEEKAEGLVDLPEGLVAVEVSLSSKCKCPRCWKFICEPEAELCKKCDGVVNEN